MTYACLRGRPLRWKQPLVEVSQRVRQEDTQNKPNLMEKKYYGNEMEQGRKWREIRCFGTWSGENPTWDESCSMYWSISDNMVMLSYQSC